MVLPQCSQWGVCARRAGWPIACQVVEFASSELNLEALQLLLHASAQRKMERTKYQLGTINQCTAIQMLHLLVVMRHDRGIAEEFGEPIK